MFVSMIIRYSRSEISLAVGLSPFVLWIIGGCMVLEFVASLSLESMFEKTCTFSIVLCFQNVCLFVMLVLHFNVVEGEKKLNNSNLIIKYPSCSNFNLGREPKIMAVIGGCLKHSLADWLSPIVLTLAWDTIMRFLSQEKGEGRTLL